MDYQNFSTFHPEGGGIVYLLFHIWILHLILPLVTHQKYINISHSLQDTQGRRLKIRDLEIFSRTSYGLYFNTYSIFHYIVSLHIKLHILFLRIVQVGNNVSHHTWWEPVVAFPTVIFSQFYVSHNYFIILTHVMSDQEGVKGLDSICM